MLIKALTYYDKFVIIYKEVSFLKNDNSNIRTLFLTFLKIGVFTFGGGYAMIALLETEFCVRKNWLDKKEFLDMTAISESTPGPTAVNLSLIHI